MSGGKCIHIFNPKYIYTAGVSFYDMEVIRTKLFVGQPEERATVYDGCVSYILVRGLVKS